VSDAEVAAEAEEPAGTEVSEEEPVGTPEAPEEDAVGRVEEVPVDTAEASAEQDPAETPVLATGDPAALARVVEALLFLSNDPLTTAELAAATEADELEVAAAVERLAEQYAPGERGIQLRELAGGYTLTTDPLAEEAARRLLSRPRAATLTPAQAETLAIVAYLQPISRPEITRIRGVAADSATTTLLERGLIEESGRSQFGAVLYRTGTPFLKLFGLRALSELPDVAQWDPSPEEQAELRERLLRAGEARGEGAGAPPIEL
jgi:segregation and condensation protein B